MQKPMTSTLTGLMDLSQSLESVEENMLDDISRQKLMDSKKESKISGEMSKYISKNESGHLQLLEDINTLV